MNNDKSRKESGGGGGGRRPSLSSDSNSNNNKKKPQPPSTAVDHDVLSSDDDYYLEEAKSDGSDPGVVMVTPSASPRPTKDHQPQRQHGTGRNNNNNNDDTVPIALALNTNGGSDIDDEDEEEDDDNEHFEDSMLAPDIPQHPSFLKVGLQRKASPWTIQSWVALSLTLDGRDKITKVLQYSSRLLAWWFVTYGLKRSWGGVTNTTHGSSTATTAAAAEALFNTNQSARFTSLYKALAESRKAFRLGRSITELYKIATMGLWGLLSWHVQRQMAGKIPYGVQCTNNNNNNDTDVLVEESSKQEHSQLPEQQLSSSSNIELNSPTTVDNSSGDIVKDEPSLSPTGTLIKKFVWNNRLYRNIYLPLLSRLVSFNKSIRSGSTTMPKVVDVWEETGTILKMVGLMGFWLGDNVNFLTSTGAFDDYNQKLNNRMERRKRWQTIASEKANQAYLFGAVAGLVTNIYAYIRFRKDQLNIAKRDYQRTVMNSVDTESVPEAAAQVEAATKRLKTVQEKQFTLFLALVKSCMDVTVFSNNPGIDWHQKLRGRKNNEGMHCLCGLISAGTVLYNNFPDATSTKS